MVILVVDSKGFGMDLVAGLEMQGHDVLYHVQDQAAKGIGEGILKTPAVDKWGKYVSSVDMVVFTDIGNGQAAEALKKKEIVVIGGNAATDRLEYDRTFSFSLAKAIGIKVPKWCKFDVADKEAAIKYLKRFYPVVLKPWQGDSPQWLGTVRDKDEQILTVESIDEYPIIVQEHINGHEACVSGWFNGYQFCNHVFTSWRQHGGIVGRYIGNSKLFRMTLKRFTPFLRANSYTGPCELTAVVKNDIPYFIGIKTRFNFPWMHLQVAMHREDFGNFLLRLAKGETSTIKVSNRWGCGVGLYTNNTVPVGLPEDVRHISFGHLRKIDGTMVASNFIGMAIGHANELEVAIERAYITLETIKAPASYTKERVTSIEGEAELKSGGYI